MFNNRRINNSILLFTIFALLLSSFKPDIDKITRYMISDGNSVFSLDNSRSLDIYNTTEESAVFGIYKTHNYLLEAPNEKCSYTTVNAYNTSLFAVCYSSFVVICPAVSFHNKFLLKFIHNKDGKK